MIENTAIAIETTDNRLELLCEGYTVSEPRRVTLARAIDLGADDATLVTLRDSVRVSRQPTITLPALRYELLSRGRGWAKSPQKGPAKAWGERVDKGYQVGPGRWSVGATDGFRRKDSYNWVVKHIAVGAETWTIAD